MSQPSAEELLNELLATIHRDGGHFVAANGLNRAVEVAIEEVNELYGFRHSNHNYRVFFEDVVSKVIGDYGKFAAQYGPIEAGNYAAEKATEAFEILRTVRASIQMLAHENYELVSEAQFTAALLKIRAVGVEAGASHERSRVMVYLLSNPSEPVLEVAFAEEDNPVAWLAEAVRLKKHLEEDL